MSVDVMKTAHERDSECAGFLPARTENNMGNTNLPQFGAAGVKNSRDTLSGEQQLAPDQRGAAGVGPSPSRPKNAPERIPGQQHDPDAADDEAGGTDERKKRDRDTDGERPGEAGRPEKATGTEPIAAFGGHANTGHSPSDAT
jgi:hypothetical protein